MEIHIEWNQKWGLNICLLDSATTVITSLFEAPGTDCIDQPIKSLSMQSTFRWKFLTVLRKPENPPKIFIKTRLHIWPTMIRIWDFLLKPKDKSIVISSLWTIFVCNIKIILDKSRIIELKPLIEHALIFHFPV